MDTNRIAAVVFAVLMVTSVVAVPWTAAAQEGEPGSPPASYYGSVTIDGGPAPAGTTIEAVVDGEVVGSITTNRSGEYGAPGRFEDKLLVGQNTSIENDSEVRFFIDNDEIQRTEVGTTTPSTVEFESGDVQQVDLAVALAEPLFEVDITDTPPNVSAGDDIPVEFNITNAGVDAGENRTITVSVNGEVRETFVETLAVNETRQLAADVSTNADDVGNATVTVDTGDQTESVTTVVNPPTLSVTDLTVGDSEVATNESVPISVTLNNPSDTESTETLEVSAGDSTPNSTTVTVPAGGTRTAELSPKFARTGERTLRITGDQVDPQTRDVSVVSPAVRTFDVAPTSTVVGEQIEVVAEVENNRRSEATVPVTVTGTPSGTSTASVTVAGESTNDITFVFAYDTAGSRDLNLTRADDTQTVDVTAPAVPLVVTPDPVAAAPGEEITFTVTRVDTGEEVDDVELDFTRPESSPERGSPVTGTANVTSGFTTSFEAPGEYSVTVSDARSEDRDTVNFTSGSAEFRVLPPADLSLVEAETPVPTVPAGTPVPALVTVENDGEVPATQTLRLVAGTGGSPDVLATRNVTVGPGEPRQVDIAGPLQPSGSSLPDNRTLVVQRFNGTVQESATAGNVTALSPLPVVDVSLQSEVVDADNDVRVNVTVANVSQSSLGLGLGSQEVTVTVGDNSTPKDFNPNAGAEQTRTYALSPPDDGAEVNVTIAPEFGENRTRTVEVEEGVQDIGLTANRTPVEPGEPIQFTLSTNDQDFDADIEVVDTRSGDVEEEAAAVTTDDGTATISIDDPGVYQVRTADHDTDAPVDPGGTRVRVLEPGDVRVIDAAVTTPEVVRTETVNVTVTLVNPGEITASENVTIVGQDTPSATQNVSVDPGNLTTVTLATNFTTEGPESIAVETEDTTAAVPVGTVEVTPALVVENVQVSPRPVTVGDTVSVDVDVRNRAPDPVDDETIDRTLTLGIDGEDENETTQSAFSGDGTYDAGETKTITFTPDVLNPVQDPGVRQVTVDESNPRTIAVSRQSVDLSLDISDQQTVGEPVTFDVNASGEPVDATLRFPGRAPIDVEGGTATETFNASIRSDIVVTKSANDTTRFVPDFEELSVSEPADVVVTRAETNVTEAFAGQQVGVSLTVRNVGGDAGSGTVNITEINGDSTLKTATTGTLSPGETRTLDVAVQLNDTGVRTLEAGGLVAGTTIVDDAVAVTDTDIPSAVKADRPFEVNVTVADRVAGGETESVNLTVTAGDESEERSVPINDNSTTERFEFSFNDSVTAQVETDDRIVATDRIAVSQRTVGLSLAVNESETVAGESVTFTVTDDNDKPVGATVEVAGRSVSTDSGTGEVTTAIPTIGNFTAVTTKDGTPAKAFVSASTQVNVTDPLAVSVANNFTTATVGPGQGTNREAATQSRDVVINNTGGRPIQLGGIGFLGADTDQYRIISNIPQSVDSNSETTVSVEFEPTVRGDTDAQFRLRAGTPRNPIRTVPLNGTGTGPDVEVNRTNVGFGTEIASDDPKQNQTINVSNDGNRPLSVDPGSLGAGFTVSPDSETVIDPGESQEFTASFDPSGRSPNNFNDILQLETNDTFDGTVSLGLTATISEGELRVSPTSLDAGEIAVDGTATFDVVVSNTGTETIETINATNETTANGLSVVAVGPDDIESTVEELGPGSQELVAVQLTQTADAETSSANVTFVPDADAVDNRTITIDATPIAPTLSTNPGINNDPTSDEVAFGEVATGSTATDTFEITNDGNATLELTNVRIDGPTGTPFGLATESDTLSIQPGETQSLTVQFTPQNADTFDESDLAFDFNNASVDGTTEVTADLTGRGTEAKLEADNSIVRFGTIGSSSSANDTIEVTNVGNTELTINTITVRGPDAGQFDADPSGSVEGNTLGVGDNATVPLQYAPTTAAAHVAEVNVTVSGPNNLNTSTATLRGEAIPPEAAVDDRSIGFGFVNAESDETASGSVEVENVGDDATTLNVTSLSVAGDDAFSVTSESSFRLGGDESQPVTVEFDPDSGDSGESITGTLTIETDDPDATAIDVSLKGEAAAPDATTNRTSIDFGQVPTGTQSGIRTVGITNDGGAAANVTDVALNDTSEFTIVSGFEGTVVPGETVPVTVRTAPADAGSRDTNLTVTTASGSDTVDPVQLRADGAVPELTVRNGIEQDFGEIGNSSSTAQTLSIENTGNATLRADISASGGAFSVPESQQTLRVSPGGTADIRVTFSPPDTGDFDGTVAIDTNDGSTTEFFLELRGSGGEANASVSPSTVDFGRVALDTETTETVTLENIGVGQLNITQTTIEGRDVSAFGVADLDASTLESDESTTFNVTVEPTIARGLSGQLTIGTGDTSDVTISLSATGTEPEIGVAASSVSFDRTRLEATSTETIDIRNTGNDPLNVSSVRVSGVDAGQFAVDSDAAVIAPGGSRTVAVEFTPNNNETAARQGTVQSATVTIRSNDTDEAVTTVDLSGQSKTPDLQLPALERFGTLQVGQTTTQSLEVTNDPTATASISLDSFTIIGSDANEFEVERPTGSLSPGESAEINVSVTPESGGIKTASLLVETNDPRQSLESVSLSNSRTTVIVRYGSVDFAYSSVRTENPTSKSADDPVRKTGVTGLDPRLNRVVTEFDMNFSRRAAVSGPELGDGVSATPVRYLDIDTDIDSAEHDETTVRFNVSKATISNLGSTEDGITLYQYNGSEYEALSTTSINEIATEFQYQSTFTNFNDLVIAAGRPDLGLTSASASGAPDTLESGQNTTVTVSADVENTGSIAGSDTVRVRDSSGDTLNSTTVNVGTGGTPTVPVDVELTGPGSRTLTVAFGGQTQDVTVDIDSPDDDGPPAGGGDDDDAPADEPTDVPAPVEEIGAEPETVESVAPTVDADAGQTVAEFETADTVEEVALDTTQDIGEVTVTELDPDTVESDTDTEPVPGDAAATQDISVPDEAEDTSATIEFAVSPDQVSGDAADLRAFRLTDGEWQPLDTEVVETTGDSIVLEAETPGFSLFAVSEVQPPEASLSLDATPAQVGDEVTLSGADSADPDGEITAYEWSVDGETLTGETVTVTLDEPGEYTVELVVTDGAGETDTVTETLVIEAADTETATPAPETPEPDVQSPTEAPPEEPGGFDPLPIVVVIVVLALAVGFIAYRRREQ